jgi:competence protein ComEC
LALWGAAAGVVAGAYAVLAPPAPFGVFFLDVGQGDATLIRAPNGANVIIDAGPPGGTAARAISAVAPRGRALGAALLTHQDLDHAGGVGELLSRFSVGSVFAPVWGEKARPVLGVAAERGVATATLQRGDRVWLDRETPVYLDVLWPPPGAPVGDGNDGSLVARLTYGASSAILTGDAPKGVERLLAGAGDPLDADILKVGHHGSKTSNAAEFIAAVSPNLAVVSAGEGNRYGHPNEETLAAFAAANVPVLSTVEAGTVALGWRDGRLSV